LAIDLRAQQQRFQLGSKEQPTIGEKAVIERLLAEAVARHEQDLLRGIPQCESKHSVEAVEAGDAPFFPGVNNHLGIAAGAEYMAQGRELGHQRLKIVDLAVVDDADRSVLVEQRLIAGREVDYRQPTVAEPDPRLDVVAIAVWSAMTKDIGHAPQQGAIDIGLSAPVEDAGYPAHL